MIPELAHFPPHPQYGHGIYRRLLRFVGWAGGVTAQVDDTHHSYWIQIGDDGSTVTAVDGAFLRAPTSACSGSVAGLQALVGTSIKAPARELLGRLPPASNCTHLSDLACWASLHRARSATWAIAIPDETDAPVEIEITRDGVPFHRWTVRHHRITAPAALRGLPLMRGFMAWARDTFSADALLAAIMLQRGLFVARGRRHLVDAGTQPVPVAVAEGMAGTCWSYSGERRAYATCSLGYVEDFTDGVRPAPSPPHVAARLDA